MEPATECVRLISMRRGISLVGLAVVLVGCGTQVAGDTTDPAPGAEPSELTENPDDPKDWPPDVVVSAGNTELTLRAWTTCWTSFCSDGAPPDPLPDLGSVDGEITVTFPIEGWTFEGAAFAPPDDEACAEQIPATVIQLNDTTWQLTPGGPAAAYRFDVWGRGPEGDVIVSFAAATTADRPMPDPTAGAHTFHWESAALESTRQPQVDAEFQVRVAHLSTTPDRASARITVTASDGTTTSHELTISEPTAGTQDACVPRGTADFRGPAPAGRVLDEIGPPPYELTVDIYLEGSRHTAIATWPDDMDPETWYIDLDLAPPLPGAE